MTRNNLSKEITIKETFVNVLPNSFVWLELATKHFRINNAVDLITMTEFFSLVIFYPYLLLEFKRIASTTNSVLSIA